MLYPSRGKMSLVLLGAIGFVALGVWTSTPEIARGVAAWKVLVVSYVGIPFFAACGLYAAYRLVRRRPAVIIDSAGITDAASALAVGRLRWDEVDHISVYTISRQRMLGIVPRDLDALLGRLHPVKRWLAQANLRLGYAPVNVPQVVLGMELGELAELLRTRYGVRVEGVA